MAKRPIPAPGEVIVLSRTFTEEDVRRFARMSGDEGAHHMQPDAAGRLMVHGLLTATLPTRVGGQIDYVAREMSFEFLRPVFTGELIVCEMTIISVEDQADRARLELTVVCRNPAGREVLRGRSRGIVLKVQSAT
jgi:acyl dehydratase